MKRGAASHASQNRPALADPAFHTPVTMAREISVESGSSEGIAMTTRRVGLWDQYFYFFMSLLIAVVIVYGFSSTVDKNLIHPALPRPFVLYIHATIFSAWVVFYILQSTLVRTHNVRIHRRIGWFGVGLGVTMPVLGVVTAITMARFNTLYLHSTSAAADLIVPFFDMVAFAVPFALAIYWRKKPEFHRRLLLIASCALTAAAFGRFPPRLLPPVFRGNENLGSGSKTRDIGRTSAHTLRRTGESDPT